MDQFDRERVGELRREIADLQRENELYQLRRLHTTSEAHTNDLRRLRLQAIRDELLKLNERLLRIQ